MKKRNFLKVFVAAFALFFAISAMPVSAASKSWNNVDDFSLDANPSGPWKYQITYDQGSSFEALARAEAVEWGDFWFTADESYTGAGINPDVAGYMEINSADNNAEISVVTFVAPEAGEYTIKAFDMPNMWGQDGKNFFVKTNTEVLFEGAITPGDDTAVVSVPDITVNLAAGEEVHFFSVTIGDWYSTYLNVTVELAAGEEPVDEEPVDEEPVDEEPVDEAPTDEEDPTEIPKAGEISSSSWIGGIMLIATAGILIVIKRRTA